MDVTSENFKARDERKPGHHWADNEVIDDFGKKIGPVGYAIYMFLGRWAGNRDGRCYKTQSDIAEAFDLSRDTVNRHITKIQEVGLIAIEDLGGNGRAYVLKEVPKHLVRNSDKLVSQSDNPLSEIQTSLPQIQTSNKEERLSSKLKPKRPTKQLDGGAAAPASPSDWKNSITKEMAAKAVMEELLINEPFTLTVVLNAIGSYCRHNADKTAADGKEVICALWREYQVAPIHAKKSFRTWIGESDNFLNPDRWRPGPKQEKPKSSGFKPPAKLNPSLYAKPQ